ncbi:hypothetical protein GCWU000324_02535 [Kingella oralis ATCC 51147]|uniref:Uncharacterized protein n=1 Tax=Kingella oralis ATCC 51147 TaxID=629741 RepID=C4GLG4_9NEIS|nr:hypothetical protein GCWU000324_02535 [Kingella oralis ATCC 51147]
MGRQPETARQPESQGETDFRLPLPHHQQTRLPKLRPCSALIFAITD